MQFHYAVPTRKTIDAAVEALEANLSAAQFGVLWSLDVPAKLQEKGVSLDQPFRILEVCNPHKAKQALEADILTGYFLPCKLAVYSLDGTTHIGMLRPTALMEMIGDPTLRGFAAEVEEALTQAIDRSR